MEELLPFNESDYVANPYPYWERLRDEEMMGDVSIRFVRSE